MKIFLDSANLEEIETARSWGVLAGVTTNPTLIARERADLHERIAAIARLVNGPISAEVTSTGAREMVEEGRILAEIADNVVIKVPATPAGLEATAALAAQGVDVNVTLIFSANQALLAARAGAALVSPFVGRLDDINHDGMEVVAQCVQIFDLHNIDTQVLAASIRHPLHVTQAALAGAHVATIPFGVLQRMIQHPLTDSGLERFLRDWREAQKQGS
ncbi:MAG TPA: fructose-6-phosphate aldolase [Sphingobacteriaceae bacterium]|nr:fructose-6-phosphate aldolase [Sphingobacteriaceae bacterium]